MCYTIDTEKISATGEVYINTFTTHHYNNFHKINIAILINFLLIFCKGSHCHLGNDFLFLYAPPALL